MIDPGVLDFKAVPKALSDIGRFLRHAFADEIPPDVEGNDKVNVYLAKMRKLKELSIPTDLEAEDPSGVIREMVAEIERLGHIEGDGIEIENGPGGIILTASDQ